MSIVNHKKLAAARKFKFGAISVALSIVVIAAVVVVNVLFSAFAYKNNWYVDLTESKLYELSDAGRELIDTVESDITIHFCAPFDKLESNYMTNMVLNLVKEISAEYDNISYDYIDINKNPSKLDKYKSTEDTVFTTSTVIVENSNGAFRALNMVNMFYYNDESYSDPWAFNGELRLITAMLQCVQLETPIAYFTNTHGETISQGLAQLLADAGFTVLPIDLSKEEIDESARIIVISGPKYDFEGISEYTNGKKSEIEKIDDFLDSFGSLMVFMEPDAQELPELETFLSEWGIEFDDAKLKDTTNSEGGDTFTIVGNYSLEDTLGAKLVDELISSGTPPKTIVKDARPVNILWDSNQSHGRQVSAAVYSASTAERHADDGTVESGRYPLVVVSQEARYIDNTPHPAYVFAVGSTEFASDQALKPSYANSYILYTMMREMGKMQVPIELELKVFESNDISITTGASHAWTWATVAIIPGVIAALGIVVYIRRKHA